MTYQILSYNHNYKCIEAAKLITVNSILMHVNKCVRTITSAGTVNTFNQIFATSPRIHLLDQRFSRIEF